jgi:hypothetical protein
MSKVTNLIGENLEVFPGPFKEGRLYFLNILESIGEDMIPVLIKLEKQSQVFGRLIDNLPFRVAGFSVGLNDKGTTLIVLLNTALDKSLAFSRDSLASH